MTWEGTDVDSLTAEAPDLLRQLHVQRQLYPAPHCMEFGAAATSSGAPAKSLDPEGRRGFGMRGALVENIRVGVLKRDPVEPTALPIPAFHRPDAWGPAGALCSVYRRQRTSQTRRATRRMKA